MQRAVTFSVVSSRLLLPTTTTTTVMVSIEKNVKKKNVSGSKGKKKSRKVKIPWSILDTNSLRDVLWCENDSDLAVMLSQLKDGDYQSREEVRSPLKPSTVPVDDSDSEIDSKAIWNKLLIGRHYAKTVTNHDLQENDRNLSKNHQDNNADRSVGEVASDYSTAMGRKRRTIRKTRSDIRTELSDLFGRIGSNQYFNSHEEDDDDDDDDEDNSLLSKGQKVLKSSLTEERLRKKREAVKSLDAPILPHVTFNMFWNRMLGAHKFIYGYDDSDSEDEASLGLSTSVSTAPTEQIPFSSEDFIDFQSGETLERSDSDNPLTISISPFSNALIPKPVSPERDDGKLSEANGGLEEETAADMNSWSRSTSEQSKVSMDASEISGSLADECLDSLLTKNLNAYSRRRSQAFVMQKDQNGKSLNETTLSAALSFSDITMKKTLSFAADVSAGASIPITPPTLQSRGHPDKFANTLTKIMKKMIDLDMYDDHSIASAIFGVNTDDANNAEIRNSNDEMLANEQDTNVSSTVTFYTQIQSSDVSGVNMELTDDNAASECSSVFRFVPYHGMGMENLVATLLEQSIVSMEGDWSSNMSFQSSLSDLGETISEKRSEGEFFLTHTDTSQQIDDPTTTKISNAAVTSRAAKFKKTSARLKILDRYPIKKKGSGDYSEIRFTYQELRLQLFTYRAGNLAQYCEVHISTIFVTQSVFLDMVTIRTTDTTKVPGGYLCTVPSVHWSAVEHEVTTCLMTMKEATLNLYKKMSTNMKKTTSLAVSESTVMRPTKPLKPPPSSNSPSKASRYKSLIPCSFSSTSTEPSTVYSLENETTKVAPTHDQRANWFMNGLNLVSGYAAAGEEVSFLVNGRQILLWSELLTAQNNLRELSGLPLEAELLMRSKPNIYIDFQEWRKESSHTRMEYRPISNSTKRKIRAIRRNLVHQKNNSNPMSGPSPNPYASAAENSEQLESLLHYKLVMILDSQRILQAYFVKKLLEIDLMADVCSSFEEAAAAFEEDPKAYSLILINCMQLLACKDGIKAGLDSLFPENADRSMYLIVVYEVPIDDQDLFEQLMENGVNDILTEPYTAASISSLLDSYRVRQEYRIRYSRL